MRPGLAHIRWTALNPWSYCKLPTLLRAERDTGIGDEFVSSEMTFADQHYASQRRIHSSPPTPQQDDATVVRTTM